MPLPTKTTLSGGAFQDSEGNLLVNGYLEFKLNQDSNVPGVGNICSGVVVTVPLGSTGSVSGTPTIWANDVLQPVNSFYRVTGYSAKGQPAWGPNNQQIVAGSSLGGGTFDLGTWVPNQVFSWTPPNQSTEFKVNSVDLATQTVVNFEDTTSVTWANTSGGILKATASVASLSTDNIFSAFWNVFQATSDYMELGNTARQLIPANTIRLITASSTITVKVGSGPLVTGQWGVSRTLPNSNVIIDTVPILFGGSASPTLPSGFNTSDPFTLATDDLHDYWFMVFGWNGLTNPHNLDAVSAPNIFYGGCAGSGVSNLVGVSPIASAGGSQVNPCPTTPGQWIVSWNKVS